MPPPFHHPILSSLNPFRLDWILRILGKYDAEYFSFSKNGLRGKNKTTSSLHKPNIFQTLAGMRILDIGCGNGSLSQALARLGAKVYGIDVDEDLIHQLKTQNMDIPAGAELHYHAISLQKFSKYPQGDTSAPPPSFDVILAMESLEHMPCLEEALSDIFSLCHSKSIFLGSHINQTFFTYCTHIFLGENILKWIPKGTHQWSLFCSPSRLENVLKKQGFFLDTITPFEYRPFRTFFKGQSPWHFEHEVKGNYFFAAKPFGLDESKVDGSKSSQVP